MDWARAVEKNRVTLTRIVAEIFALLGLAAGGTVERLPQALYLAAERLLRPTESALRRLIVIAARGLVVKPSPKRARSKGVKIERKASGRMSFRLFDTRKTFDFITFENPLVVHVKTYTSNPFNPFDKMYQRRPEELAVNPHASQLCRRLAAVALALETIPHQAQRMARWRARRKLMEKPKFTAPLRPGSPPGLRVNPTAEVDFVLQECHGLAWDALREDSS
jgi:hypothetical protein